MKKKLTKLSAKISAFITMLVIATTTAFADTTAPNGGGDVAGGINFINWIGTILTDYAWALALIALIPVAITYFIGGDEADHKGKHGVFRICLGIFILCCGNAIIQAARSSFSG